MSQLLTDLSLLYPTFPVLCSWRSLPCAPWPHVLPVLSPLEAPGGTGEGEEGQVAEILAVNL
jgi:hypothetical protein